MFTGIIETHAIIEGIAPEGSNITFTMRSPVAAELKVDQSLAHNGVCLTVTFISGETYRVTAVNETLEKTNLKYWAVGDKINLERAMQVGGRLDGHFVQGHVDTTATCIGKETLDGSWNFTFLYPEQFAMLLIEKGSVCINGVSLTVFNVTNNTFTVAIIPYTYEHTNFNALQEQGVVNIEYDVLGKYVNRMRDLA